MKWRKIQQDEENEPRAPEEEPMDYIIDEATLAEEAERERRGGIKDFFGSFRNLVTGQRKDEEVVQEYVASMDDDRIVVQTDKDFRITFINERAKQFFNLSDDAMGKGIAGTMICSGDESNRLLERVRHNIVDEEERFENIVVRAYNSSYNISWLSISVEAIRDEECGIVGIMWSARDISDSVLMSYEESTTPSASLHDTIENFPAPLMVVGMGRVIAAWNHQFLELWGLQDERTLTTESLLSGILMQLKDDQEFVDKVIRLNGLGLEPLTIKLNDGRTFHCLGRRSDLPGLKDCVVWSFQESLVAEPNGIFAEVRMEDVPDLLWEIDSTQHIKYVGNAVPKILGHRVEEMRGRTLFDFVHKDDVPRLKEAFAQKDEVVHRIEARIVRRDGNMANLQMDLKRLPEKKLGSAGHIIVGNDISDRKRAERSLVDMVHAFRTLMEHTNDGVWMMDESGVVIQWNEAMEQITSVRPSESIGRALPDLDPLCRGFTDIYEKVVSRLNHRDLLILQNQVEIVLTNRSGASAAVKVEVHPITTDKGHLVMGICTSVVPRERREPATFDLYQRIVENSPDMVINTDHRGTITYCNRITETILGKKWDDVVGRAVADVFPGWPGLRQEEGCGEFDLELRDTEGRMRTFHLTGMRVADDQLSCQFQGEEITEKLAIRRRLLASDDLGRKLMEAFPDPAFLSDEKGLVSFANDQAIRLFRLEPGKDVWLDIVADYDREAAVELLQNVKRHGHCHDETMHLVSRDMSQYAAKVDVEPVLNADAQVSGFLLLLRSLAQSGSAISDHGMMAVSEAEVLEALAEVAATTCTAEEEFDFPILPPGEKWKQLAEMYPLIGKQKPRWLSLQDMCGTVARAMGDEVEPNGEIDGVEIFADPLADKVIYKLVENSLVHGKKTSKVDVKFFVGERGGYIVVEDDGVGVPDKMKEEIFEYSFRGRNGHDLHFVREVLFNTQILISEVGESSRGARFEIFIPMGKFRKKK